MTSHRARSNESTACYVQAEPEAPLRGGSQHAHGCIPSRPMDVLVRKPPSVTEPTVCASRLLDDICLAFLNRREKAAGFTVKKGKQQTYYC